MYKCINFGFSSKLEFGIWVGSNHWLLRYSTFMIHAVGGSTGYVVVQEEYNATLCPIL